MTNIIVVFPRMENAQSIRNILVRNGFSVAGACTTGAQAISLADGLNDGIIVCCYKMADMLYSELREYLPEGFELLLLASEQLLAEGHRSDIMCLSMPLKVNDLVETMNMMVEQVERRRRRLRSKPKARSLREKALIQEAKELLMARNHMTEEDAHRYIQKCSMDSGTNMVETAQMVLAMLKS